MFMEMILVGLNGDFWIYLPRNDIKMNRSYIIGACLLCILILHGGMGSEFKIVDSSLLVIEIIVVQLPWNNTMNILLGPYETIRFDIFTLYQSVNIDPSSSL